jgi:hypothetical protein
LTCSTSNRDETDVLLGTSADQIAASQIGEQTFRASLELSVTGPPRFCDDYPCPYGSAVSWSDPRTPRYPRTDPRDVWEYLTGGISGDPANAAEVERLRRQDRSILDYVHEEASAVKAQLGTVDQQKLDQYLTAVRTLELELDRVVPVTTCTPLEEPPLVESYPDRFALMLDLQAFALECDITRVISFVFATSFGPGGMPWAGVAEDFHNLTHHEAEGDNLEKILQCIDWEMQQIAAFIARLGATPDGQFHGSGSRGESHPQSPAAASNRVAAGWLVFPAPGSGPAESS